VCNLERDLSWISPTREGMRNTNRSSAETCRLTLKIGITLGTIRPGGARDAAPVAEGIPVTVPDDQGLQDDVLYPTRLGIRCSNHYSRAIPCTGGSRRVVLYSFCRRGGSARDSSLQFPDGTVDVVRVHPLVRPLRLLRPLLIIEPRFNREATPLCPNNTGQRCVRHLGVGRLDSGDCVVAVKYELVKWSGNVAGRLLVRIVGFCFTRSVSSLLGRGVLDLGHGGTRVYDEG
jgi:hypothetical protein